MRKMFVIAVREYLAAVKTKAFLISLLLMPVIMGGSIAVQVFLRDRVDTQAKRIAVVDHTGALYEAIATRARERNTGVVREDVRDAGTFRREDVRDAGIFKEVGGVRTQVKPAYLFERVEPETDDTAQVILNLSERVRKGELFAFIIIGKYVIAPEGHPGEGTVAYHSNSPTYDEVEKWVRQPIHERVQELRIEAANLNAEAVRQATQRVPVENLGLVSLDEQGRITKAEVTNEAANIFVPLGLMMLMFMMIMVGAQPLVQSVIEEKMQRIAEVLLGSISPFPLMMGKLVGMVGVSLTIATLYLVGAFYAVHRAGYAAFFPSQLLWWFVVFQTLAVLMYGAIFIAIGAAVSDMKEAQSLLTPVMLIVVAPMFVWISVVREPAATKSMIMSLIPPATPMLMLMRQAVPPGVPLWQPLLGILLVLLTTVVCVFAAGRIFRVGILMQGKGARIGDMMRWVIRG